MYHTLLQQIAIINVIDTFDEVSQPEQANEFWAISAGLKASLKFCAYQIAVMCSKRKLYYLFDSQIIF